MEKPLAARAGVGWQGKHTKSRLAPFRLLAVPGRDLSRSRPGAGRAGGGSLRRLHALPRRLPHQRVSGAVSARRAALHLLPHHRAQGAHRPRAPTADGKPDLRLRRLPGGLPLEQVRERRRRDRPRSSRRSGGAGAGASRRPRRRGIPETVRGLADQAHRPGPLRAECADRDRKQQDGETAAGGAAAPRRSRAAGAGDGGLGIASTGNRRNSRRRAPATCPARPIPRSATNGSTATGLPPAVIPPKSKIKTETETSHERPADRLARQRRQGHPRQFPRRQHGADAGHEPRRGDQLRPGRRPEDLGRHRPHPIPTPRPVPIITARWRA